MDISLSLAKKLSLLLEQKTLPKSKCKNAIFTELKTEEIIIIDSKKVILDNPESLIIHLQNQYNIPSLKEYITVLEDKENATRADFAYVSGDSKRGNTKVFQGFLVNCYTPILANFKGQSMTLNPTEGTFTFIFDYEDFVPDASVTIVGLENAENFRKLENQAYLFSNITPLFVCRYPQNQNKHLIQWLQSIANPYIHFGDFDPSGIGIYMNEFKKHLGEKANFFVPPKIEKLIHYGSKKRYALQRENFDPQLITEENLKRLRQIINQNRKALEQELLLKSEIKEFILS
ncbi:hypothetical protein BKI52_16005 [marine bacterium AO1-C]|nr:hypothetical protein BKI52_16005 [marine bacterium AO1-C]